MKSLRTILFFFAFTLFAAGQVKAQFMPVVYDNTYGKNSEFVTANADFQNGDVIHVVRGGGQIMITWLDRLGEALFTKQFTNNDLAEVSKVMALSADRVLIVGGRKAEEKGNVKSRHGGRAIILNREGNIERTLHFGQRETVITNGELLANGNLILSGTTPNPDGGAMSGFVTKISPRNNIIYEYIAATGETCDWFNVFGDQSEYVNAGFSSVTGKGSSVVKLDENGKPYFITRLPDPTFVIENMASTVEGEIYLVGQGEEAGGTIIKLRQEGDIVFHKRIAPATADTKFNHLIVLNTGELLVGGNDTYNSFFSLLRSDGTDLSANVDAGIIAGLANNPINGDCIVSIYDPMTTHGRIIKLSKYGRRMYEKATAAKYTTFHINKHGDLLMAAPETGRLTMLSNLGEMLFDRFVAENKPELFADAYLPANGSVVFTDASSRLAKLGHGIYVSDIITSKPINGTATATFTITLSGFSYSEEDSPLPVTVDYKTVPVTAAEGMNYNPVSGTLSFVPSMDGVDRYMNRFVIEVPILANNLLEGDRVFTLNLMNVKDSYLIKAQSKATIDDQPAVAKLISTSAGIEGERDVVYTVGIFKTNGTPITNATKADVVIDGIYGKGTADRLDFDMGRMPRLVIAPDKHSGEFNVTTFEDARYELAKTVVVNFNKIHAMSDTKVSFNSEVLSCSGTLYDQAAYVTIESLGDQTKLNNVVSGLFKVTLVKAKDGTPLVNNSGADVIISTDINSEGSTAVLGKDFVLTNNHDLRIWGDDRSSAVNLNGVVLYTPDTDSKTVSVSVTNVQASPDAGPISISPNKNTAQFKIINN